MGIYPQPNTWQCGPFALKHALIGLGVDADEDDLTEIAGATRRLGADEKKLARAARAYDCDLPVIRREDPDEARRALRPYLRRGLPILLCVEQWSHWVTLVKAEAGEYIILDSAEKKVLIMMTWPQLRRTWVYDKKGPWYDLHPVIPRFRVRTRPRFSRARVKFMRRPENRFITRNWDEFVTDLSSICRARTALSEHVLSLGEFLRRHKRMIIDQVDYWHGWIDRRRAARVLDALHFVADTVGMVIPADMEKRAIAGVSSLMTLWAAGEAGAEPIYGSRDRKA